MAGKKLSKAHVYLFSDMLMVAKQREKGGYKFHSMMTLDNAYVQAIASETPSFRMVKQTADKGPQEMTVVCTNVEVMKKWVKQIKNMIIEVNLSSRGLRQSSEANNTLVAV